jgi:hypothetical protein
MRQRDEATVLTTIEFEKLNTNPFLVMGCTSNLLLVGIEILSVFANIRGKR